MYYDRLKLAQYFNKLIWVKLERKNYDREKSRIRKRIKKN